jgi:pimeloyl-ACP methyl ester carboxylesterase
VILASLAVTTVLASLAVTTVLANGDAAAATPTYRLELHLAPSAHSEPTMLLMTVGGPVYCMQLKALARKVGASLACADYATNGYRGVGSRANRREDWGNSAYLTDVAKIPGLLRGQGVRISKLVLVGVSYSGFGDAELVATHPELRPAALIIVDSYLDLPARYAALPAGHPTKTEIERELGGTLEEQRAEYEARSPSHHLDGLAQAMNDGMRLVDVWSVSAGEEREFRGATCSRLAHAHWLRALAGVRGRSVVGYVTHMRHAHALWDRGRGLLALASIRSTNRPLRVRAVAFTAGASLPAGSYCGR